MEDWIAMKIVRTLEIHSPIETVWGLLQDIPTVSQCLPGAQLTESPSDDHHQGTVSVEIGPMTATFDGAARITTNRAEYRGRIDGKGTDRRGGNQGELTMEYQLQSVAPDETSLAIDVDVDLSGSIARFGRSGLINQITDRLIVDFLECLEAKLAAVTGEEAASVSAHKIRGISLVLSSLGAGLAGWYRRLFSAGKNPPEDGDERDEDARHHRDLGADSDR